MKRPIWFKAKNYGWGWYPATWQAWVILLVFTIYIVHDFVRIDSVSHSSSDSLILWLPNTILTTIILIAICWLTGEKPRWRWGGK